jgi:hypothetical protein
MSNFNWSILDALYEPEETVAESPAGTNAIDRAEQVQRTEDKPFRPCLDLSSTTRVRLAPVLPRCADAHLDAAVRALAANIIEIIRVGSGTWCFYSRDNDHYAGLKRYVPRYYRRRVMVEAVGLLEEAGLIFHDKTEPSPMARHRSRIRPTAILLEAIRQLPAVAATELALQELIVLRDEHGQALPYRDTELTRSWRRDVAEHNEFLKSLDISLLHPLAQLQGGIFIVGGRRIDPARKTYHRICNRRFSLGGRWYGPWWQQLPPTMRRGMLIGGAPTVERDISGCHMRLLCARAGVDLMGDDPYQLPNHSRHEVKMAINIMLNARSWQIARGALAAKLEPVHGTSAGGQADRLRATIQRVFPALRPFWNTGFGLALQNADSEVCKRVQQRLRSTNVPCLSVHDSFIVPQRAHVCALEVINEEFDRALHGQRKLAS